jgi:hypothetical protein
MTPDADRRLLRHLVLAVLVKLLALAALWWWLVRDHHVAASPESTAAHLTQGPRGPDAGSSSP